jgi:hypothetical protein
MDSVLTTAGWEEEVEEEEELATVCTLVSATRTPTVVR